MLKLLHASYRRQINRWQATKRVNSVRIHESDALTRFECDAIGAFQQLHLGNNNEKSPYQINMKITYPLPRDTYYAGGWMVTNHLFHKNKNEMREKNKIMCETYRN